MGRETVLENIVSARVDEELPAIFKKARQTLLAGGIVGYPTESFYGLAADIENENAIEKLFSLKEREREKPLLIILPNLKSLEEYVQDIPDQALKLIEEFWPGGLTMIFNANSRISPLLTANTGKIGIRYSSHPLAALISESIERPVTGTSANISGHPPCVTAREVYDYFENAVDLIIDGGPTKGGKGSTILDVTKEPPAILREGIISKEAIEKLI